jgi:hypothetical protein
MKFTIERKILIKMLKMLSLGGVAQDDHLRIAAQDGEIALTVEDRAGTSYVAIVEKKGVCFFRFKQFLPLLRTYKNTKRLTIEINPREIKFGSTSISRGLWEISLFENPAIAPLTLPKLPDAPREKPDAEQLELGDETHDRFRHGRRGGV